MHVLIRVYRDYMLIQVGQGYSHQVYDWVMALDFIRDDDEVTIQACYKELT